MYVVCTEWNLDMSIRINTHNLALKLAIKSNFLDIIEF